MAEILGFIPARGGSKGVPHKNRRIVGGRPLIAYTIAAARSASSLARVVVSTDDPQIEAIARAEGAEVVSRPADIAGDTSPVIDAVRHALEALERLDGFNATGVALLQPTSPFRAASDIDAAVGLFLDSDLAPVCSVYRVDDGHPARMYRIEDGRLMSLFPDLAATRRQDLPAIYHRNGSIYVFGQREIASGVIIGPNMQPFVMDADSAVNIDAERDLLLMRAMLERGGEDTAA